MTLQKNQLCLYWTSGGCTRSCGKAWQCRPSSDTLKAVRGNRNYGQAQMSSNAHPSPLHHRHTGPPAALPFLCFTEAGWGLICGGGSQLGGARSTQRYCSRESPSLHSAYTAASVSLQLLLFWWLYESYNMIQAACPPDGVKPSFGLSHVDT